MTQLTLHRLVLRNHTGLMAENQFEHHGQSGEFVMLPSGEMVPAAEAEKVEPAPTKPATKAKG
jgi:hypothetical protein